jgi:hypothetical protein
MHPHPALLQVTTTATKLLEQGQVTAQMTKVTLRFVMSISLTSFCLTGGLCVPVKEEVLAQRAAWHCFRAAAGVREHRRPGDVVSVVCS